MKKIILTAATFLLIILAGCKSASTGNPKEVLNNFFSALSKKDFDGAKKFATKDSDGMISMMQMGMQHMQGMNDSHSDKMLEMINNMNMGDPVINGDNATVTVTDKKSNESTDFLLKKENGNWKVAFDVSTLTEMANKKMKEQGSDNMNNSDSGSTENSVDSTMKNVPQSPQMPDTAKDVK